MRSKSHKKKSKPEEAFALVEAGWELYRYTSQMVKDGRAINQIERVLK